MSTFSNISIDSDGSTFSGTRAGRVRGETRVRTGYAFSASFPLFLIREAWDRGADFEDLADGYGEGMGTMGGDWSGIRDSSEAARAAMLERALNHLFGSDR